MKINKLKKREINNEHRQYKIKYNHNNSNIIIKLSSYSDQQIHN